MTQPALEMGQRAASFVRSPPRLVTRAVRSFRGTPAPIAPHELHQRFARKVSRLVSRLLGEDSERDDIVQDVFVQVLLHVGSLRDPACLEAWIIRITVNTVNAVLRRRRLMRRLAAGGTRWDESLTYSADFDGTVLAARAFRTVSKLTTEERALLSHYWFTAMTPGEMAADRGCSVSTVKRRLRRARQRFELLAERDPALATFRATRTDALR